jgi:hypothetical protein
MFTMMGSSILDSPSTEDSMDELSPNECHQVLLKGSSELFRSNSGARRLGMAPLRIPTGPLHEGGDWFHSTINVLQSIASQNFRGPGPAMR